MYSYKSSSVTIGYESFRTRFFYIVVWHQASVYTKLVINIKVLSLIRAMKILLIHVYNDVCVIPAYIWKWEIRSLNMKNVFTYHILVASTIFRYCIPNFGADNCASTSKFLQLLNQCLRQSLANLWNVYLKISTFWRFSLDDYVITSLPTGEFQFRNCNYYKNIR